MALYGGDPAACDEIVVSEALVDETAGAVTVSKPYPATRPTHRLMAGCEYDIIPCRFCERVRQVNICARRYAVCNAIKSLERD